MQLKPAQLVLETGEVFYGQAPATQDASYFGEVVFNTGMAGYVESLTDPSYAGQILVFTYPLIGNYGVSPQTTWESNKIHVSGVVMSELAAHYSNHTAELSLYDWLIQHQVPLLIGADTRAITRRLRSHGVIPGAIQPIADESKSMPFNHAPDKVSSLNKKCQTQEFRSQATGSLTQAQESHNTLPVFEDFSGTHWVKKVSITEPQSYGSGEKLVIAIDCGMKENIIRSLLQFPVRVKRVPHNYDFTEEPFDAVFISNGPGDPLHCQETITILQKALKKKKPTFGICLGTQLLALAVGAKTYKLPFGHRAHNQPCLDTQTQRCYLTSQNHSYAVDEKTLPADWRVSFRNLNDQSVEGIEHQELPFFAVQFHPEAAPGPMDAQWLFQKFYDSMLR